MQSMVNRLLVFVAAAALFVSCSKNSPIVGHWVDAGAYHSLIFKNDGLMCCIENGKRVFGSYSYVDADHIKLDLDGQWALAGPMIMHISISNDDLTLTNDQGMVLKYRRY